MLSINCYCLTNHTIIGDDTMNLSLMTFSMNLGSNGQHKDPNIMCITAKANGLSMVDLIDFEINLYGVNNLKNAMQKYGITCGCLITTAKIYTSPETVESELTKSLALAQCLGAKYLMVVPGQYSEEERSICSRLTKQEILNIAIEGFRLAVKLARPYGIQICFENTPHDYKPLASAEDCQYVLDRVPDLGLVFDTGNFRVANTACDELAIYEQLKNYIVRVHLKDVVIGNFQYGEKCVDGQKINAVVTGSGVIPMEELIHKLKQDGYSGDLAIEYAAPAGTNEDRHESAIAPYCGFIRSALGNGMQRPPYKEIEGIGIPVSRIFFGTAISPLAKGENCDHLLDSMLSMGINAFDCARGYGKAENALGNWIQRRNNRNRVVILTKCGNVGAGGSVCVNGQVINTELEESLNALQTDYIDIFLLHRDDPNTPVGEIIECLNDAQRAGKIKVFGASNWTHQRIAEANTYARQHGLLGFTVSSPNYGLAEQVVDLWGGECVTISGPQNEEARRWYTENQMPVIAYSSLGRGFFSGKFKANDWEGARKVLDIFAQKGYLCQRNMERLHIAEEIANRDNCNIPQVAMRYIFGSSMNVFAIVSTTSPERMQQNIVASNNPLPCEDCRQLNL